MEMVVGQAIDGSFSSVLVTEQAEASIFNKICPRYAGCTAAVSSACPLAVSRSLLRYLVGRHGEGAARTLRFQF